MGLIQKLATAVRGGAREVLEVAVDANGLRIFAQEIHECENAIQLAKQDLSRVSAERIRLQRENATLESALEKRELQAAAALEQGDESLAREVAEWIVSQEALLQDQRRKQQQLEAHETQVKKGLHAAINQVRNYRGELRMAQATASARSAAEKISSQADTISVRIGDMRSSLQRIKNQQELYADRMEAMESIEAELSDRQLERKLALMDKGSGSDPADSVLERIRKRSKVAGSGC